MKIEENLGSSVDVKLRQRYNFAVQHLFAVARFARHCHRVERANEDQTFGPFFDEILSYAPASVLSSVAALEANINESFSDLQDGITKNDHIDLGALQESWEEIEALRILEKYDRYLQLTVHGSLDTSIKEYQFVKILIDVRNALVHFKPEWHAETKLHDKIGRRLRGKFELSPFVDENAPIFPMRCMTHGLAEWSVKSVLNFNNWFASTASIPDRFSKFHDRLTTVTN